MLKNIVIICFLLLRCAFSYFALLFLITIRQFEKQPSTPITGERYVLSDREGMKQIFERPDGWPHTDRIPLTQIEDRNGNTHRLSYDSDGKLDYVMDHAGRYIKFKYAECGLLEKVSDHTGRIWQCHYDSDIEHLIGVTTPYTPEYPKGLTTRTNTIAIDNIPLYYTILPK